MKRITDLLGCSWILMLGVTSVSAQESDCRLKLDQLKPLIARFNPFFAHHQWSLDNRMEMARMGPHRVLIITQDGCKRHHITFTLLLDPSIVANRDSFWLAEVKSLFYKTYYQQDHYQVFGPAFEKAFKEKFQEVGLGRAFNFPVGTRNFICELRYQSEKGARITIEMVQYLFRERVEVRRQGIAPEQDDGWNERKP